MKQPRMHQTKAGFRLPHQYGSLTEIKQACDRWGSRNNVDMCVSNHRLEAAYFGTSNKPVGENQALRPL